MEHVLAALIAHLARCEHETYRGEETAMNIRAEHIQAILANPFYAITVTPQLVEEHAMDMSDEQWIQTNARLVQDMKAEAWLAQVLAFLQSGDASSLADPCMNPCHAVNIAPIFAQEHAPAWSQEEWVQLNVPSIQEMGVEPWLAQLLDILEGDYITNEEIVFRQPLSPGKSPRGGKQGKLRRKKRNRRGF